MIDYIHNKLILGEIEEKIVKWDVWFRTPFGLCRDVYEAVKLMQESNLDPRMTIIPTPVAISNSIHEVVVQ